MSLISIDRWNKDNCTLGILKIDGFSCFTLELPDKNNEPDISCIPRGRYGYYKRNSPKNGNVLELRNVPDRTFIQVHAGNFTRQIQGCILVGESIKFLDDDDIPDVTNSRNTLKKLLSKVKDFGVIEIW